MKFLKYILLAYVCLMTLQVQAQSKEYTLIHQGNRCFVQKDYKQAELFYRRALSVNPRSSRAFYNLGNVQLALKQPKAAIKLYEKALPEEKNKNVQSMIYHNMGVILQGQKDYADAIDCYKNSLRRNPANADSRYNLALCQYLLKKQPPKKQNDQSDNKNKGQQQQKQQSKSKSDNKQQSQNQNQMSKQNAESLLKNIVEREERKTQEKLKKIQQNPPSKRLEKNW